MGKKLYRYRAFDSPAEVGTEKWKKKFLKDLYIRLLQSVLIYLGAKCEEKFKNEVVCFGKNRESKFIR